MWQKGLAILVSNPKILGEVLDKFGLMPNIETSTMGGHLFWNTLANVDGWKIQKNSVFGNCRILDPNNMRKGWGGETAVKNAFTFLIENY